MPQVEPAGPGARVPGLVLTGPTAVGKSEVALILAERWTGEIVCVDSMQVYRGFDIGTAKPSTADQQRIRHHLLDLAETTEAFDGARFVSRASQAVVEIRRRGGVPILCGGTGFYFKALLCGLGESPPSNPALRAELEGIGVDDLLRELREADPATYERIDRRNPRRIRRAVEILRLSRRPVTVQRADWSQGRAAGIDDLAGWPWVALGRGQADLRGRIDARVDEMFQQGLVRETEALLRAGLASHPVALQAIGYRQVVEHLQGGRPLSETIALVKQRTRQFAKRQLTYLRRQLPVVWVEAAAGESATRIADRVEAAALRAAATVTKVSSATRASAPGPRDSGNSAGPNPRAARSEE